MAKKSRNKTTGGAEIGGVDLNEVERLLAFMEKHGLEEFEYARGGVHIRLKRPSTAPPVVYRAPQGQATAAPPASTGREGAAEVPRPATHGTPAAEADLHVIKSPIVGTFYSSPSPNADPFVTVGAKVAPGQALCIIEAMKLMNEIEADVAGEIVRIFVENGKPVEYGEPLFGIRPSGKK
jgi:acetyl-CoA carboxylase biotin carboxyl carrier protein